MPSSSPIFLFRPLLSSGPDEHHHIEHLAWVRSIASRKHHFDNQQSAARIHRTSTVAQDRKALFFAPVMDDMREKIGIPAVWNALEEIPALYRDAIRKTSRLNQRGASRTTCGRSKRMPRASE